MESTEKDDYNHRYHAGNVGDVFKHSALIQLLQLLTAGTDPVHYLETHAGEGGYPLNTTGEWTEGFGKLLSIPAHFDVPETTIDYLWHIAQADGGPHFYPGSPLFAAQTLRPGDRLTLWEKAPEVCAALAKRLLDDARVSMHHGDGVANLVDQVRRAETEPGEIIVLIDPPYSVKSEWMTVPETLIAAVQASNRARFVLWYPLKSLTRPNAMIGKLRNAGVGAAVVEWTNTPLELKRNRLNGSGLVLVRPPQGAVSRMLASLPPLADVCATHDGRWSVRAVHWSGK